MVIVSRDLLGHERLIIPSRQQCMSVQANKSPASLATWLFVAAPACSWSPTFFLVAGFEDFVRVVRQCLIQLTCFRSESQKT